MRIESWKEIIFEGVDKANHGNHAQVDLIAQLLAESEQAKQVLREKGYGWTGLSLLKTVTELVPYNPESN